MGNQRERGIVKSDLADLPDDSEPKGRTNISISTDVHSDLKRIKGDDMSFSEVIRVLINCFNDPSQRKFYRHMVLNEEFYRRAIIQREIDIVNRNQESLYD